MSTTRPIENTQISKEIHTLFSHTQAGPSRASSQTSTSSKLEAGSQQSPNIIIGASPSQSESWFCKTEQLCQKLKPGKRIVKSNRSNYKPYKSRQRSQLSKEFQ